MAGFGTSCAKVQPPRRLHKSKRDTGSQKNIDGDPKSAHQLQRHGYRALKTPKPICKATIRLAGKETRSLYRRWQRRGRPQRQNSRAIPPPGVSGIRIPIWADLRIPLATASSPGGAIRPLNATAAGEESSEQVSALRISTPRYPSQNGAGAPVATEVQGGNRQGCEAIRQIIRAGGEIAPHAGLHLVRLS